MKQTFNEAYTNFIKETDEKHVVMCFHKKKISLSEFDNRVNQILKHLTFMGVKKGDGVGYSMSNNIDIIPLFTAIARLGAFAMPLFTNIPNKMKILMYKSCKVSYIITTTDMVYEISELISERDFGIKVAVIEQLDDDTMKKSGLFSIYGDCTSIDISDVEIIDNPEYDLPLLMGSSSGTTGKPKFVLLNQKNVGAEMIVASEMIKTASVLLDDTEKYACVAFPLSTSVMMVIYGMIFAKYSIVFDENMSPMKFFENIEFYKCNMISSTPAYFESLTMFKDKQYFDISSVKNIGAGMDFCSPALIKRMKEMFTNLKYYTNGYGLVETCNIFTYNTIDVSKEEFGETAILNVCKTAENFVEIRDSQGNTVEKGVEGEIFIKGPNVITRYYEETEENKIAFVDGWFKTGDIARKVSDNSFVLMGREKYFIKRGGRQVSPIVVQNEINKVEGVKESGVVGVPHPLYGEMIWAFVVKKEGCQVELKDIKKKCRETLPFYMFPDNVVFLKEIPRKHGAGKINFELMEEMAKKELEKININMN